MTAIQGCSDSAMYTLAAAMSKMAGLQSGGMESKMQTVVSGRSSGPGQLQSAQRWRRQCRRWLAWNVSRAGCGAGLAGMLARRGAAVSTRRYACAVGVYHNETPAVSHSAPLRESTGGHAHPMLNMTVLSIVWIELVPARRAERARRLGAETAGIWLSLLGKRHAKACQRKSAGHSPSAQLDRLGLHHVANAALLLNGAPTSIH